MFKRIRDDIAPKVAADTAFQNAKKITPGAARVEHDKALSRVKLDLLDDDTARWTHYRDSDQPNLRYILPAFKGHLRAAARGDTST